MDPAFHFDEPLGKIVGHRLRTPSALRPESSNQRQSEEWRKALGGILIPKGVYRFPTHEAADEWLWKMITRPRKI